MVLLVTRDRELIQRIAESSGSDIPAPEYVERLSQASRRLKTQRTFQVLAVDLGASNKHELEALRGLMLASPDLPVLAISNDDPVLQAGLLAQGAQDVLLKATLNGFGLARAAQSAMQRKAREIAVFDDNERARVTLSSIGDGVLSTDNHWVITFLNPIAEKLTGWTCAQAVGHHVAEVFQVLDGVTRTPITPQIETAVGAGNTIILPPNCLLVRRVGPCCSYC